MTREAQCGSGQAHQRLAVAERYLELAQLVADQVEGAAHNVAVGNAVLAGIAASDALCCHRLGRRSRDQDHRAAVALLGSIDNSLAKHLLKLLQMKDPAHYSDTYLSPAKVGSAIRSAEHLVESARESVRS